MTAQQQERDATIVEVVADIVIDEEHVVPEPAKKKRKSPKRRRRSPELVNEFTKDGYPILSQDQFDEIIEGWNHAIRKGGSKLNARDICAREGHTYAKTPLYGETMVCTRCIKYWVRDQ